MAWFVERGRVIYNVSLKYDLSVLQKFFEYPLLKEPGTQAESYGPIAQVVRAHA